MPDEKPVPTLFRLVFFIARVVADPDDVTHRLRLAAELERCKHLVEGGEAPL